MLSSTNFKKTIFAIVSLVIIFRPISSYADWDNHYDHHDRYYRYHDHPRYGMTIDFIADDFVPVIIDGARYYYYDGLYYAPARHGYVLVEPPVGAIVPVIPSEYRPVIINGITYYTDGGVYYVHTHHHRYQVVMPPMVQTVPQTVVVTQPASVVVETPNQTKVAEGIGVGAVLGALAGGIIGHQMKGHHDVSGALVGGATGAAVGGVIGAQIPSQSASMPAAVVQPSAAVNSSPVVSQAAAPTVQESSDESVTVNIPNSQGGYTPVVIKKSGKGYVGPQGEYYPEFPKVSQLKAMYSK